MVYFDNSATTPVRPEAAEAMLKIMTENYGNPSSGHALGRAALNALDTARRQVAKAIGAKPGEIYFTSGGTEADNWAIFSAAHTRKKGRVIISATEHEAVKNPAAILEHEGYKVVRLSPDSAGRITVETLKAALTDDTVLVSIMYVNNEVGAVNPIKALAAAAHKVNRSLIFHTDAVQALGKLPCNAKALGVDLMTVSSHKLMGPKGAGALYIREGLNLAPFIHGGGQEKERRSGTEAMPAIVGFGTAAQLAAEELGDTVQRLKEVRSAAVAAISEAVPQAVFIGEGDAPHILNISLPGWRSEVLTNALDSMGFCVSNASACRRGRRSEVLEAMGLGNEIIDGALRLSFAKYNTPEETQSFAAALKQVTDTLRRSAK